jgi:hypothetical protein
LRLKSPHDDLRNGQEAGVMKKTIIAIVVWGLALGRAVPLVQAKDKPVAVFLNLGTEINMLPEYWSLGFQVDLHPMKFLMVSPEFNLWFGKSHVPGCYLVPAILLNLKLGRFFAGAGPAALRNTASGYADSTAWGIRPKFNIGYKTRHFKLLVGAIPRNGYVSGLITAGVGF